MNMSKDTEEKKEKNNYSVIKYTSGTKIQDIALLNKDFDLHNVPKNYLRRRSQVEDLIFRAVASETQKKAPMASFKLANDYLHHLQELDILTGIKCLKSLVKLPFEPSKQVSMMIHRVGDTLLLDEFDVNSFFLELSCSGKWQWFRDFLVKRKFHIDKPDFSRKSLVSEDLYGKFLYHSVNNPSPHLLPLTEPPPDYFDPNHHTGNNMFSLSSSPPRNYLDRGVGRNYPHGGHYHHDAPDHGWFQQSFTRGSNSTYEEDFLQKVEWQMEDLSYLVGSDLAIFGTKTHPCISLKLSHLGKPISVLTGLDIWLENIINEIPEVAMCYHDEGIVMQEYQIYKTDELPTVAGFQESEVRGILRNLAVFLKRNATKEGHTYWLFKEKNSEVVKLYDLTSLRSNNECSESEGQSSYSEKDDDEQSRNPFILPVAVLCYRLAERRMQQHRKLINTNRGASSYSEEEEISHYNDTFRLLRNCIHILSKPTGQQLELLCRATLLMCQLYMEAEAAGMTRCFRVIEDSPAYTEVSFHVDDLLEKISFDTKMEDSLSQTTNTMVIRANNIVNVFKSGNLEDIISLALTTVDRIRDDSKALVLSPHKDIFLDREKNLSEQVNLLLIDTYRSMSEKILLESQSLSPDQMKECEFLIRLCKGVRDSYFAYMLLEKCPSYPKRLSVLECFTQIFQCFMSIDVISILSEDHQIPPLNSVDHRVISLLSSPALDLIADRLDNPITMVRSYQFLSAVLHGLYETIRLYKSGDRSMRSLLFSHAKSPDCSSSFKSQTEMITQNSIPLVLNNFVNQALVPIRILGQWIDDFYGKWTDVLLDTLNRLDDSISALSSCQPIMASVMCSCQARLYRLEATTSDNFEYQEEVYHKALQSYQQIKSILKRPAVSPDIWSSTQYDIFMTCMQYYDKMFKRACHDTAEPNITILKRAVSFISDYLGCDSSRLSDNARILHTLLRVRHVIGSWYLGLRNEKTVNHEAMVRDLKLSYEIIGDNESHCMDIFTIITYLVTIQTSRKDTLSVRYLRSILEDAIKVENSLNHIINDSKTDSLIEVNSVLLTKSLLAVVQKMVLKLNTSKGKKQQDVNPAAKTLYASMLRCKSDEKDKSSLTVLSSIIELIKSYLKQS